MAVIRRSSVLKDNSQQVEQPQTDNQKFNKLINFNLDGLLGDLHHKIQAINSEQRHSRVKKSSDKGVRFSEQRDIIIINDD